MLQMQLLAVYRIPAKIPRGGAVVGIQGGYALSVCGIGRRHAG